MAIGDVRRRRDGTYVETEKGPVRFPKSARTTLQRVRWLLLEGYTWAAWLLAAHADKVLVKLLKQAFPDTPWNNIAYAARRS